MNTQSFYFSSSTAAGAQNLSADGSQFEVTFDTPLHVPGEARRCEMGLVSASVWNTSQNISAAFGNNTFQVVHRGTAHTIVIDDGLYSLDNLDNYLSKSLQNLGVPAGSFTLSGDDATQRCVITIALVGDQVNFNAPGSCSEILGFTQAVVGPAVTVGQHFFGASEARLNRTNLYLILSDMVQTGLTVNALARGVIGQVPIVANPGEQIVHEPSNVNWFAANELIGRPRGSARFSLVNQDLRATPTSGDTYSFVVQIRWG